jgi:hypothetical protein
VGSTAAGARDAAEDAGDGDTLTHQAMGLVLDARLPDPAKRTIVAMAGMRRREWIEAHFRAVCCQ